ncbi:MAG: hypothetical protein ACREXS_21940 [Gammaproteobacteria bacterium]
MQVGTVVLYAKEAGLAVVAALHDVQGYSIEANTRTAGHASSI